MILVSGATGGIGGEICSCLDKPACRSKPCAASLSRLSTSKERVSRPLWAILTVQKRLMV